MDKVHTAFIESTVNILKQDERIAGVLLGGSYITKDMDEFSDLDFVVVSNNEDYESVMNSRVEIANSFGHLLSMATGEHVGEPRLLICLYNNPLLHIDLKFVSLDDVHKRVEDPCIVWQRNSCIDKEMLKSEAKFPIPSLQWMEDRFWIWVHYNACKLGRGELFEVIECISFFREKVVGPLSLMCSGKLPRGVRKIETDAIKYFERLKQTVAEYNKESCRSSIKVLIELYIELRDELADEKLIRRTEAQKVATDYFFSV